MKNITKKQEIRPFKFVFMKVHTYVTKVKKQNSWFIQFLNKQPINLCREQLE